MQQSDDIRYYLGILRRRYPYFLAAFMAVLGVSVVVAVVLPPIYRSEAKILVESQQIPSDLVRSTVTGFAAERIEVTRQRITAREGLIAIADKYSLFPEERAKMSTTQLVELLRQRIFILPFDLALAGRRSREGALTVAFTVGFEYERPDIAARVANELVTLILNEDIRSRTSKASETTQFLSREAQRLQAELTKSEVALTEFKQRNRDALPERVPFQMAALERAETNLKAIEREINDLSEARRLLDLEMSVRQAAAQSGNPQDIGQNDPFRQLELLRSELAQKSVIFADSHPEIKAIKGQIAALEKQIAAIPKNEGEGREMPPAELSKLDLNSRIVAEKLNTIERQIALYTTQKDATSKAIAALTTVLSQAPEVQINLALIERQRDGLQKALDEISGKLAEARLGEQLERDQQAERFQIIEQPITPQSPVRPNRLKIITFGFFLAGLAGAGAMVGLELLNQSIRTSSDLSNALNRHPLVVIPYITTQQEGRRRVGRRVLVLILAAVCALLGLLAVHLLYMPLDQFFAKILLRLNL
jgi:succinoglycan biosynthesis transport protein ExoP